MGLVGCLEAFAPHCYVLVATLGVPVYLTHVCFNLIFLISVVKPTRCTIFEFIEYHSTCLGLLSVHRQEFETVHTASAVCHTG